MYSTRSMEVGTVLCVYGFENCSLCVVTLVINHRFPGCFGMDMHATQAHAKMVRIDVRSCSTASREIPSASCKRKDYEWPKRSSKSMWHLRANPTALGAFLGNRETTLASVLERHISPEIFCHDVAVLTAPNYADCDENESNEANDCEELR